MERAIKELENFIGSWNGKESKFSFEGDFYYEEDIHTAQEALDVLKGEQ